MKPNRAIRVGHLLKRELAELLCSPKFKRQNYFLTVTDVKLSRDLKYANVWISVFGEPRIRQQALANLEEDASRLRFLLADRVRLRYMPDLNFKLDESLDNVDRIDALLKQSGIRGNNNESGK
jgi:ribosome-binding factor A